MPAPNNIERRKRTPDFSVLLGTYHWVWNGHLSVDAQITPAGVIQDPESDDGGTLTLSLKPRTRVAKPANVIGEFALPQRPGLRGSFTGLTPRRGKRGAGTLDIKSVAWEDTQTMLERGHALWVSEGVDDNGHPFVGMYVTENDLGWDVVGKRQADGYVSGKGMVWEGLTDSEIERLGLLGDENAEGDEAVESAAEAQAKVAATAAADAVAAAASAEARPLVGGAVPVGVSELPVVGPPEELRVVAVNETLDTVPTAGEVAAPAIAGTRPTDVIEVPVTAPPHVTEPAVDDLLDGVATAEDVATPATVLPRLLRIGEVPADVSELPVTAPQELPAVALDEPLDTTIASVNARDAPPAVFAPLIETIAPETPVDPRETAIIHEEVAVISAIEPKSFPAEEVIGETELPVVVPDEKRVENHVSAERTAEEAATRLPEEIRTDGIVEEEVNRVAEPVQLKVTEVVRDQVILEALEHEDTEKTVPSKRKAADAEVMLPEEEPEQKKLKTD